MMWRFKVARKLISFNCSRRTRSHPSLQNQVPLNSLIQSFTLFSDTSNPTYFGENHNFISQRNPKSKHLLQQKPFDEVPLINTDQVQNVVSILSSNKSLESSLDKLGLTLNEEFIMRLIESPLVTSECVIQFFKWGLKRSDFFINSRVLNCVVNVVGTDFKKKEVLALWDLVKDIGGKEKGVVKTEMLNQVIKLFWRLGRGQLGLEVFDKFEQFGCEPNPDSYYFTIEALYRCSMYDDAWTVCEKMIHAGTLPESWKIGHVVSCFCKGDKARQAHSVYLMAKKKGERVPLASIKHLIRSLCRENDTVNLAVSLLNELSGDGRKHAIKLFSSVICGLCRIKDVEESKQLLFKMINEGPPPGNAVFNSVITLLSKAGEMEEVMDLLYAMEVRGLRPDVYTYCVVMSGCARKGRIEEAQRVLSEAKKNHTKLNSVAYHILTRGYCKLEEFDKALVLLKEMKDTGIQPNADEYNKMIQSLCLRASDWRTAEKLLEEMKENGLHFNEVSLGLVQAVKELEEHKSNTE